MKRGLLVLAGAMLWASVALAQVWPDCGWGHRIPFTVSNGAQAYSAEIRVDFTSANIPAGYVFSANGDDVRVYRSDSTTPVDHVVTTWDATNRRITLFLRPSAFAASESRSFYLYLGNADVSSAGTPTSVFPNVGVRLRSRVSTVDPTSRASAEAAFSAATVDVYDAVRSSVTGVTNRSLGGSNGNFGWCISAILEVTPATAGTWGFRYGADFGLGGDLSVNGVLLEEQWNDNLWWANNYGNTAETLEGSITLAPGWHKYVAFGFEDCCDGAVGFQARAPGGAWLDLSNTNFNLRGAQCVTPSITVSVGTGTSCSAVLDASKLVEVTSDPDANTDPYAIPGAIVTYTLEVVNDGQRIDDGTIVLTDALPPGVSPIVSGATAFQLVDGAAASGLTLDWQGPASTTDAVSFSTDGINFTYTPVPDGGGADGTVTHIRFSPTGRMNAATSTTVPSFQIVFQARVD